MLSIACASDIHGHWRKLEYPKADILCITGDFLRNYYRNILEDAQKQLEEFKLMNEFLGTLDYQEIFIVLGNHERVGIHFLNNMKEILTNGILLHDEAAKFGSYSLYGSPWQPAFGVGWAFNLPQFDDLAGYPVAKQTWAKIPDNTNILLTHTPSYQILDRCEDGRRVGCPILLERIKQLKDLKINIHGHIHTGYGVEEHDGVQFVNAALCDDHNRLKNKIRVVTIE